MKAPFPWFGGKSRVAHIVWERFGDVATYNEPFAGSLAVLLGRPYEPRIETVNDLDCYLANFWRALQADPDGVAKHADSPVNEADLHARHRWLVEVARGNAERCMTDPDFYDVKIAGWWVWGQCLWIGSGWCQSPESATRNKGVRPALTSANGLQRSASTRSGENPHEQAKRPHLSDDRGVTQKRPGHSDNGGSPGVHRLLDQKRPKLRERGDDGVAYRRWQGGGAGGGSGVIAPSLQKPQLSGDSGASGMGVHSLKYSKQIPALTTRGGRGLVEFVPRSEGLYEYLRKLAERLRRVRVCCGDWKRVLTPSVTTYIGTTAVFLDPPYDQDLRERCYSEDHNISQDVAKWAIDNGDNHQMRIALCGYEGEHTMPETWECVAWKAHGGYSRSERGKKNRERERIWFSPHCLQPKQPELTLTDGLKLA